MLRYIFRNASPAANARRSTSRIFFMDSLLFAKCPPPRMNESVKCCTGDNEVVPRRARPQGASYPLVSLLRNSLQPLVNEYVLIFRERLSDKGDESV